MKLGLDSLFEIALLQLSEVVQKKSQIGWAEPAQWRQVRWVYAKLWLPAQKQLEVSAEVQAETHVAPQELGWSGKNELPEEEQMAR